MLFCDHFEEVHHRLLAPSDASEKSLVSDIPSTYAFLRPSDCFSDLALTTAFQQFGFALLRSVFSVVLLLRVC